MKTKEIYLKTFICIIILSLSGTAVMARGTAAIMGNLQSVSSDGPFDAMRNPAAMAFGGTSAGINFFFTPWAGDDTSTKLKSMSLIVSGSPGTGITAQSNSTLTRKNTINLQFATSISLSEMFALGIGVTVTKKDQENYLDESTEATLFAALETFSQKIQTREQENTYTTFFSLGVELTKSISMGYAVNLSIGSIDKNIMSSHTNTYPVFSSSEEESNTTQGTISGELSAYFIYKTTNHQTGVNLYSGRYSWLDYSFYNDSGSDFSVPFNGSYTNGATLMAGHYWRFSPLFAAAFEVGATIPAKYTAYSFTSGTTSVKQTELDGLTILATIGLEVNPLRRLTAGGGLTYVNKRGGSRSISSGTTSLGDYTTNYQVNAIILTGGVTYEVFAGMEVNITAGFTWLGSSIDRENIDSSTDMFIAYNLATSADTYQVNFNCSFVKRI